MENENERKLPYTNLIRNSGYIRLKTLNTKLSIAFLILNLVLIQCSETKSFSDVGVKNKTIKGSSKDFYYNGTFRTGNVLWDNILNECTIKPTIKCLQKNVYSYLDDSLGFNGDVKVTDGVCFKKNKVDVSKYRDEANIIYLTGSNDEAKKEFEERSFEDNEIDDDESGELPDFLLIYFLPLFINVDTGIVVFKGRLVPIGKRTYITQDPGTFQITKYIHIITAVIPKYDSDDGSEILPNDSIATFMKWRQSYYIVNY